MLFLEIRQRGAALVESALAISVTMMFFLAAMDVVAIGMAQLNIDAAAFVGTRIYASEFYGQDDGTSLLLSILRNMNLVNSSTTASQQQLAFNTEQLPPNSPTDSSVSLIIPEGRQLSLTSGKITLPAFGIQTQVSSSSVDVHYKTTGNNEYFWGLIDPNPFFITQPTLGECVAPVYSGGCPYEVPYVFGDAATLTSLNLSLPTAAITNTPDSVFAAFACHQRVYAAIAQQLFSSTTRPAYHYPEQSANDYRYEEMYTPPQGAPWSSYPLQQVFAWQGEMLPVIPSDWNQTLTKYALNPLVGCDSV